MKIGLPRLRFSRKLIIVTLGITVLLGGTSMAALYFGGHKLGMDVEKSAIGGTCLDVQTMVIKTPSNRLWLRKFIRMENASGHERVRTALRIAGLLAKKNAVDLIHVSVLDTHGPTIRADMRARAIGAEVLIAVKPENLKDMKAPAMATYYEGPVSNQGRFYGDRIIVDLEEIGAMMTAMRTIEDKPDCVNPNAEADAKKAAEKKNDHGKKDEGHAKPDDAHAKPDAHGEQPAEAHGEEPASDHGEKPADESASSDHGADPAADPAKEQSFVDSMLAMVGLGSNAAPELETHEPVAEEPKDALEAVKSQMIEAPDAHEAEPAKADEHAATSEEAHPPSGDHEETPADDHAAPAEAHTPSDGAKTVEHAPAEAPEDH